ncbi:MAG: pyruvate kinase [Candidatus Omnitrophota bacterium]
MYKTKIICTIGPASDSASVLRKMMLFGMDIARLNFSHADLSKHKERIDLIRTLNKKYRRRIRILQDLEGYRIRIGRFKGVKEMFLRKRQTLVLSNRDIPGYNNLVPFDYRGELTDIKSGVLIYIDDGNICLLVKKSTRNYIRTEVLIGGILKERKGINMPDMRLKFKGLTDKDALDIQFGIRHKVEYIAQSFVRDEHDILPIKKLVEPYLPDCKIIAKIENRQGIKNIERILTACDGIMIARGDMGVSIPLYEIPIVQKQIIRKCNKAKKLVITATQMLESMVENLRPTRAEVTDIANAVLDGSNCVMLSAETAIGKYPAQAVDMMNKIIGFTETHNR